MADTATHKPTYVAGLSLGAVGQFTGLAVVERVRLDRCEATYAVRHLTRFPPGTPYSVVIESLKAVFGDPPVKGGRLVIDQTGVGRSVFDRFRSAGVPAAVSAITVTAGYSASADGRGGWAVPKQDLVGTMQLLLQNRRLRVASELPDAQTLAEELQRFQIRKLPSSNDADVEWRERPHDDLVLAVAVACWQAERRSHFLFAIL